MTTVKPFPESLLVVRLGAIGDVANALVFAEALHAHAPKTRIGWLVHPLAQPLLEGHPALARVHVLPRARAWRHLRALRSELRAARYELAVDLQRIAKSALLARLSGAPRVLGFDRARAKEFSWLWTRERIPAGDARAHMAVQYLEFARALGVPAPEVQHRLPQDADAEAWARALREALPAAPIVLNVGASKPRKHWPAAHFARLVTELLRDPGAPLLLTGGAEDQLVAARITDAARAWHEAAARGAAKNLVGLTNLRQLYHLFDHARVVVSADSGPMHLAAARGARVVALFGFEDAARTGPWGAQHRILRAGFDGDITRAAATPHTPRRMDELDMGAVLHAVREQARASA